jgi:hypothetical protein
MEVDDLVNNGLFRIRVRKGDWEVDVSAPDRIFVLDEADRLIKQISNGNLASPLPKNTILDAEWLHLNESNHPKASKPQTLNEFYRQFKLNTNLDRILAFGYWCEVRQGQPHFTSEDILAKYKEAKQPQPANIRRDFGTLVSKGFFMEAGRSEDGTLAYELTRTGIDEVELKWSGLGTVQ